MHHTRHHTRHAQQSKVLLGNIDTNLVDVPQTGEEEARKATDEQRGCKRTTTTATAIGSRGGYHFRKQHQSDIRQEHGALTSEQRVVQNLIPVSIGLSVQQQVDATVTLTIQSREQEDEQTQCRSTNGQFDMGMVLEFGKHALADTHHSDKVERYQTAGNT